MIAVAIIAIALVAALGSQSQSVSLATEAKFTTTVAFLAQGKMAELEVQDPEELDSDSGDFGEDYPGYRWESEVSDIAQEAFEKVSGHIKRVDLAVYLTEDERYRYSLTFCRFTPKQD